MSQQFSGKVALVTGAGAGIGRACALAFAKGGAKVVVSDLNVTGGEETVSLIKKASGEAVFIKADVANSTDVKALFDRLLELYGRLDIAHNNAGIEGVAAKVADLTEDDWDKVISVNLRGVWICMKYELAQMVKQGSGAIVNTGSVSSEVGLSKHSPYSASKHAVLGLTKTAALEYIKQGIRVNAVLPGLIDTAMIERSIVGEKEDAGLIQLWRNFYKQIGENVLKSKQPSGRMGSVDEVAKAVVWLASDDASYINGHALVVDGGFLVK